MQNYIPILVLIFLFGCNKQPSESDLLNKKDPKGKYGEPVSEISTLSFSELLTNPNNFLNQNVLVEGVIKEVCPMRGCWVQISDMDEMESVRVKVKDGDIVFPLSARDHKIIVQGNFVRLDLSKDQAINWKIHLAKERGVILNPENINLQEEDYYEYRINCNGAVIL